MGDKSSLEAARRLLEEAAPPGSPDPTAEAADGFYDAFVLRGIRVQVAQPGTLLCHFTVPSRLLNSGGFLHGGATASLVDLVASAVFRTAGLRTRGEPLEMNISYLDAAFADEEIDIEAIVLRAGKAVGVAVVELKKKSGKIIAQARYSKYLGASSVGGYSYLYEPLWWVGMITMIVGEVANFAAYAFAPAILVTPLGALSIIISAVLAHVMLREKLHIFGILGCVLCVVGSITIVLHAPPERGIESVTEVWDLATEPAFMCYAAVVIAIVAILVYRFVPLYGQTHIMVYIGVCSLVGSISVMSVKALGIALKLTFSGMNQLIYPQTWTFSLVVIACVITQMNYLNKALDTFNTAVVSPIYYTMFTSLTILASVIMFKDWDRQNPTQIVTEMCGFVTILSGTFLLHKTKDMADGLSASTSFRLPSSSSARFSKQTDEDGEGIPLRSSESFRSPY